MFSKFKVLSIALVALMAFGFWSYTTKADVTGSFTTWITMQPQTTSGETTAMDFDFEAELDLTVTISGLAMGHEVTFGVGGIEHYIMTLEATIGALEIKDEFVFATPYYNVQTSYFAGCGYYGPCFIHPKRGHYGGVRRGTMLFVKKRVAASMSIGGVTFSNLFMLEDTTFPSPTATDPGTDYQTQHFAVGDIITIKGETPSGIMVQGITALCADEALFAIYPKHELLKIIEWDYNLIKKKRWLQTVESDCYGFGVDTDGGFKPAFAFTKEVLSISNIPLPSGITMDTIGVFSSVPYKLDNYPWNCPGFGMICNVPAHTANIPFFIDTTIQIPIAGLADVLVELWTDDIDFISLDKLVLTFQLPEHGWKVSWYDFDGDLTFTSNDAVIFTGGITLQGAFGLNAWAWMTPTVGLRYVELDARLPISWPEPYGLVELKSTWVETSTPGQLEWANWSFRMKKEFAHNTFEVRASFDKYSFDEAAFIFTVLFDI